MNVKTNISVYIKSGFLVCAVLLSLSINAVTLDITAEYKPSISEPENVSFKNTTPESGHCASFSCHNGVVSIGIGTITFYKQFNKESLDLRDHTYGKIDSNFRDITLINVSDGSEISAKFRLNLVGYRMNRNGNTNFNNSWFNWPGAVPDGGCLRQGDSGHSSMLRFAWEHPEGVDECYKKLHSNTEFDKDLYVNQVSLGYVLELESPLYLASGEYESEVAYTLGVGAEVDFGAPSYSDNQIVFRITATVEHSFHMQFPAGSNRIQLEPSGGWGQWLNSGRMPAKMERNVDFSLTTSGPISIALQCEQEMGTNCALRNQNTGENVELETRVTLPGLKPLGGGAEVKDYRLATGPIKQFFIPEAYSYKRQSTVHFRVNQPHVETMLKQPGSEWAGNVTLMFEAGL